MISDERLARLIAMSDEAASHYGANEAYADTATALRELAERRRAPPLSPGSFYAEPWRAPSGEPPAPTPEPSPLYACQSVWAIVPRTLTEEMLRAVNAVDNEAHAQNMGYGGATFKELWAAALAAAPGASPEEPR